MNLHITFGHRVESYHGEHAAEPLLCWSEYEIDENPLRYDDDVAAIMAKQSANFAVIKTVIVSVSDGAIMRQLYPVAPTLEGKVVP